MSCLCHEEGWQVCIVPRSNNHAYAARWLIMLAYLQPRDTLLHFNLTIDCTSQHHRKWSGKSRWRENRVLSALGGKQLLLELPISRGSGGEGKGNGEKTLQFFIYIVTDHQFVKWKIPVTKMGVYSFWLRRIPWTSFVYAWALIYCDNILYIAGLAANQETSMAQSIISRQSSVMAQLPFIDAAATMLGSVHTGFLSGCRWECLSATSGWSQFPQALPGLNPPQCCPQSYTSNILA